MFRMSRLIVIQMETVLFKLAGLSSRQAATTMPNLHNHLGQTIQNTEKIY
jgi:hypothetical protein